MNDLQTRPAPLTLQEVGAAPADASPPPAPSTPAPWRTPAIHLLAAAAATAAVLLLWTLLARATDPTLVPGPNLVWARFLDSVRDGTYVPAFMTTLEEAVIGWVIAAAIALPIGYLVGRFRALEDALAPYLASSQAMPIVAIAPLLVVWVGFGLAPKVIVCALIAFFPMLATTAGGVRSVPTDLQDAARVFGAGPLAVAVYVDLPLAARTIFAGVKVAATLSVTGAVVGEFVSADQGLGYLINLGRTSFDTPLMFVALISLMAMGALAYTLFSMVERLVVRWEY